MNSKVITLDPVTSPINAHTILAKDGFRCALLSLMPGDEMPSPEARDVEEHLLFVIEGDVTVRLGEVNTMLGKDEALLIPAGKEHVITAHASAAARLLRVDVPPRQVVTPQILSFDRR